MAGPQNVHHYVTNRSSVNQPTTASPRPDRLKLAQGVKISSKRTKDRSPDNVQPLANTAPAPGYDWNPGAARNILPQRQYQHHSKPIENGAFDDTITSGFEDSSDGGYYNNHQGVTDVSNRAQADDEVSDEDGEAIIEAPGTQAPGAELCYNNDGYGNGNANRYSDGQHQIAHSLKHQSSRSPLVSGEMDAQDLHGGPAIVDRFLNNQNGLSGLVTDMPVRSGQDGVGASQSLHHTRKRALNDERIQVGMQNQQQNLTSDEDELSPQHNGSTQRQEGDRLVGNDVNEAPPESQFDLQPQLGQDIPRDRQMIDLNIIDPDYDDQQLISFKYQDLKSQTWEKDPHAKSAASAQKGKDHASLEDRLKACVDMTDQLAQYEFFQQLSMTEWEESGEILIDRFGAIMKNMRLARQIRRTLVSDFEEKIEQREALVRGKSAILDKKFKDMKKGGEGVLSGGFS